jgi:hypothetical protein
MTLPLEQFVAGTVTGIGVLGLIIDRIIEKRRVRKMNGEGPPYMVEIRSDLNTLKTCSAQNHEGIEVLKAEVIIMRSHLTSIDEKVYNLATKGD